ncbi:transglycosylase family protein [Frankia sp. CNm7]|uniref:transglycosylase family protein n=1 Tax=Frankia nepalensis TaxID=1836974 RepID=UPI001932236B|nr:transglycosylase family protein [Frankia nepalensis]MBL7500897.1 transglycosylase family protein [Frankia nepalensis]MBL7510326.1 transglycosylase family protein [Frankia nepalensis]MBL7518510.1 transglycosylase family protein [Frankia nepalensis]
MARRGLSTRVRALVLAPALAAAVGTGLAVTAPAHAASKPVSAQRFLSAVIPCESGGNPRAVNSIGAGGLFQFLPSTWHSVGGTGLPQHASVSDQWAKATKLYNQQGTSPWYASKHCWSKKI